MDVTIRERYPATDPRLGRHRNHDARSRLYPYRAPRRALTTIRHQRHTPILDQGATGSCTGNAGIGCLGTGVFYATVTPTDVYRTLDEMDALALYSAATRIDPYPGTYQPDDTGSDGLSIAKALTDAGMISGYEHTFSVDHALQALMDRPLICGTMWTDGMFTPTLEGLVRPTGVDVGGHEYVVDGYDQVRGWVWFANSWSTSWGVAGRFAMQVEDWADLLGRDGDVTVLTPRTLPPPAPVPDPDHVLAAATRDWVLARHVGSNAAAAKAVTAWRKAKGL